MIHHDFYKNTNVIIRSSGKKVNPTMINSITMTQPLLAYEIEMLIGCHLLMLMFQLMPVDLMCPISLICVWGYLRILPFYSVLREILRV